MSVSIIIKILCGFSFAVGLCTLIISCWTFTTLMIYNQHWNSNSTHENRSLLLRIDAPEELNQLINNIDYGLDETTTLKPSFIRDYTKLQPEVGQMWAHLDKMSDHFINTLIAYTWVTNVAVLLQIIICLVLIFSSKEKISIRSKYLVIIHFIVLIILLMCFFLCVGYNRKQDVHHTITTFNDHIMKSFEQFRNYGPSYLIYDLNLYYLFVGINIGIVFIVSICTCCLMRFYYVVETYNTV